ncbi:MAG TPA: S8 family serine peptidase [Xanthobacteraceae bacterium]|nr:S8 family serine peptidase [Xanthobacteraceae bacterium]
MKTGTLRRVLLAAVIAVAAVDAARAQCISNFCPPPFGSGPPSPGNPGPSNHNGLYIVGGIVIAIVAIIVGTKITAGPPSPPPSPPIPPPPGPYVPPVTQVLPPTTPGPGGGAVGPLRSGFNQPPAGEVRFVPDEVLADSPLTNIDTIAARNDMTCPENVRIALTGRTLHRCIRNADQTVQNMIRALSGERQIAGAQPNYLYELMQGAPGGNAEQYAPDKLEATEAHRLATGNRVSVAVIDSGVDPNHPDLAGAIAGSYEPAGTDRPHPHGTGMAGAIASRGTVQGIAPGAELLTVRAFSANSGSAEGTTLNIIKGLDWAAEKGARVVNMSFAGPADPRLRDALAKANAKGMVLIAAAGNAGPTSPPLYPAADPSVIAVTAVDASDALFSGANRGKYIAVAAPGVDVLVPAPDAGYQLTTGTSVAAAEVSGVVALLIERNPRLTPKDVRRILMRTAKHLGPRGDEREYGAGLVNALEAVTLAK